MYNYLSTYQTEESNRKTSEIKKPKTEKSESNEREREKKKRAVFR